MTNRGLGSNICSWKTALDKLGERQGLTGGRVRATGLSRGCATACGDLVPTPEKTPRARRPGAMKYIPRFNLLQFSGQFYYVYSSTYILLRVLQARLSRVIVESSWSVQRMEQRAREEEERAARRRSAREIRRVRLVHLSIMLRAMLLGACLTIRADSCKPAEGIHGHMPQSRDCVALSA